MATYTPQEFVVKLGELQASVGHVPAETVPKASQIVKANIQAISPGFLRGVGKKGRKITVRYTIVDHGDAVESFIRGSGPWPLIEYDTPAHQIPRASMVGRRYAVFGGNVFSVVEHPGTRGKHLFQKGSVASFPAVNALFETDNYAACRRVFT